MRCSALIAVLALASPAGADPKPAVKPMAANTDTKAAEVKPATCKRRVVGRGLERKVICELEISIHAAAPKPGVMIVSADGRKIVGRPQVTDPFVGLSRHRSR
jgi:hypothetical protein